MKRKYTVHVKRIWVERFGITVSAKNAKEARAAVSKRDSFGMAAIDAVEFDWKHVEQEGEEVFGVDAWD